MKRRLLQLSALAVMLLGSTIAANATILVSAVDVLSSPNNVFSRDFFYDPATMGSILTIQTWGYGGTSNAPGGANANGIVIGAGGFDPRIALFSGAQGSNGALIASNDDQGS